MASVSTDSAGSVRVRFTGLDNKRKTIHLGKVTPKGAENVAHHVEALLAAKTGAQLLPRGTVSWLTEIGNSLREKLAKFGLIEPVKPIAIHTLHSLIEEYKASRTDLKRGTLINLDQAGNDLVEFFGADRDITTVTEADAEKFYRKLLADGLAFNTARRRTGRAKQYFAFAGRKRVIESNPFSVVKTATSGNKERQVYVSVPTIQSVLDACPSAEWRLIVALSRFGGLRCPSEHLGLTWADIHWDKGRFTVHSPKTEHFEGKDQRIVPIFPELLPFLQDAFEAAEPGQTYVITRNRCESGMGNGLTTNWRTQFMRILRKAGVKPWPRLFHNLRSACQTDLANRFPEHVVCEWLGNSKAVAREHYLQVTEAHYELGASQNPAHFPAHPMPTGIELGRTSLQKGRESRLESYTVRDSNDPIGTRNTRAGSEKSEILGKSGPFDGPLGHVDPELARLIDLWPTLPESTRQEILGLAKTTEYTMLSESVKG